MTRYISSFTLPRLQHSMAYPYNVLAPKQLREIGFEPITIFYGSNGSGKSTLLNIIARALDINMLDRGNDAEYLQGVIDQCHYQKTPEIGRNGDIPSESRFIRSEDVMHSIVKYRQRNEAVKQHVRKTRPDLYERFFCGTPGQPKEYVWSDDQWIFGAISEFGDGRSNGELAYDYFQDHIDMNSLVLLDEPENSLAPKLQKALADMILNYSRFFKCQFIIATHSPFMLSIPGARIYNLDRTPSCVCRWSELENMQVYMDLFRKLLSEPTCEERQ